MVQNERQNANAPILNADQQAVINHPNKPLLVLTRPETEKTTTLIKTVVDRMRNHGLNPNKMLVLTFGQKATTELRDRITNRLNRTTQMMPSITFHSFCYTLLRQFTPANAFDIPLRLPSGPKQSLRLNKTLSDNHEVDAMHWPDSLHPTLKTHEFTNKIQTMIDKTRQLKLDPKNLSTIGRSTKRTK